MKSDERKLRSRCPLCGGKIVVSFLYQYSLDHVVGRNGRLRKTFKKVEGGPMEVAIAACSDCEAFWDTDSFDICDGVFYDRKYIEGEGDE